MKKNLKICALGALYHGDQPSYLHDCLCSIEKQTLRMPIFIAIDGPIPIELENVLDDFSDLNIVTFRFAVNRGLALTLRSAINKLSSDYDYAIRFDADDINLENRFSRLHEYLLKNDVDLISSHMIEIDEDGNVFSERTVPIGYNKIAKNLPYRNPINHPASAFKISSVLAAGGYQEMPFFEDWYLWIRMFHAGFKIENIDDFLVSFRATDVMVARRYGLSYVKYELNFFHRRSKEKLINPIENWLAFLARLAVKGFGFKAYRKVFYWIRK